MRTAYTIADAICEKTAEKQIAMVTRFFGFRKKLTDLLITLAIPFFCVTLGLKDAAFSINPRMAALINPECSATPTPSSATKTTPRSEERRVGKKCGQER